MKKINIHYYNSIIDLAYTINCVLDTDWFDIQQDRQLNTYILDTASDASTSENVYYESDYIRFIRLIEDLIDNQIEGIDTYFTYI